MTVPAALRDLVVVAIQGYFENGDVVLARVDINLVVGIFVVALGVVLLAQEHVVGVDVVRCRGEVHGAGVDLLHGVGEVLQAAEQDLVQGLLDGVGRVDSRSLNREAHEIRLFNRRVRSDYVLLLGDRLVRLGLVAHGVFFGSVVFGLSGSGALTMPAWRILASRPGSFLAR